jgi:hypothetical protein
LSQAPPVLELEIANCTPLTKIPGNNPPTALGPKNKPIMKGVPITKIPGGIIFLIEALVEI